MLKQIIEDEGFCLNNKKTRILGPRQCRKITGLVINNEGFGIGRKQKRILRAKIHRLHCQNIDIQERKQLAAHI